MTQTQYSSHVSSGDKQVLRSQAKGTIHSLFTPNVGNTIIGITAKDQGLSGIQTSSIRRVIPDDLAVLDAHTESWYLIQTGNSIYQLHQVDRLYTINFTSQDGGPQTAWALSQEHAEQIARERFEQGCKVGQITVYTSNGSRAIPAAAC